GGCGGPALAGDVVQAGLFGPLRPPLVRLRLGRNGISSWYSHVREPITRGVRVACGRPPSVESPASTAGRRPGDRPVLPGGPGAGGGSMPACGGSIHSPHDDMGIRHCALADARHQADPRPVGSRRVGAGDRAARPDRGTARRLPQAPQGLSGPDREERVMTEPATDWRNNLERLGLRLPAVAAPVAAYIPAVRTGSLVYTSGQLPFVDGELPAVGKVGAEVSTETATESAR